MPGLLESCSLHLGTSDLYQALGVRKEASEAEVRRGYHKASLKVHPDRVPEPDKEAATAKFQVLGKVYAVLSDKEQRTLYDEQGIVDDESESVSKDRNWEEYWRLLFKKLTVEDIKAFEEKYKESEEEKADVIQAYMDFEGDMDSIMESVLCVTHEDEPRIREIINQAIKSKEVPSYNTFVKESKKKREQRGKRAHEEAKEAEEMKKEFGLGEGEDDLKALIQRRQKDREKEMDSFLANMEAKYCNNPKKGGKKAAAPKRGKK
ncbi:dnaJ homolog subfamily C member 9 [Bombina bombina]|uniref:dnaJ homolog subfamily C member 9 n=1 Tax=Bombina bombina TaxID=8345 RepID=UPI00235B17F2|nr:dnaJ homolog subfamily C member 9 [Bombina bombina]